MPTALWLLLACCTPATTPATTPAAPTEPSASTTLAAEPVGSFPIVFHVATRDGAMIVDEAFVQDWLAVANAHFAPAGIALAPELRPLPEGWATLRRIRERRQLKRFLVPRRINIFLVDEILDPVASKATRRAAARAGFEPSGRLAGAHIEADGHRPRTYVILSAQGGSALSLTHELGHFFGVAHHADPNNIMSYGATRQHFDERQLKAFHRKALRYRRTGDLAVQR
jgi:hypothetical protein